MNKKALFIIKTLTEHGYKAVYAGGCVRDYILGIEPHDFDIATNALPDQIESVFPKTLSIGKAFGVILVVIDNEKFEVATFRSDASYSDGRHPDAVKFSSLEEDARRRDLTINGMFYDPLVDKIIDVVGGQTDLRQKVVRLIGDPIDRIKEDNLRLLRVIRFASRLNFEIEPDTFSSIEENSILIKNVSSERIADEFTKILRVKDKKRAIELLFDTGLMFHILPEVFALKGCEQPPQFHPESDCAIHTILCILNLPEDASDELLWGALLHDVGKPPTQTFEDRIRFSGHDFVGAILTEKILKRLKFSNDFVEHVVSLVKNHMKFSATGKMKISKLKRFINLDRFEEHLALHKADCLSSHGGLEHYTFVSEKLKEFEATPEKVKLDKLAHLISGYDLINMGFKQGPIFREILTDVEDQQLECEINNRDQALEYVKNKYFKAGFLKNE